MELSLAVVDPPVVGMRGRVGWHLIRIFRYWAVMGIASPQIGLEGSAVDYHFVERAGSPMKTAGMIVLRLFGRHRGAEPEYEDEGESLAVASAVGPPAVEI